MAKKITKKRLKELVSNAQFAADTVTVPGAGDYVFTKWDPEAEGWEINKTAPELDPISSEESRQNRLDLYDGTAELLLKLTKNIDNIKWVNQGAFVEGKGRGLRILVEGDFLTFFTSPFFGEPESITGIVISQDLEEKILLRANTSVPNLKVLKLLNEL